MNGTLLIGMVAVALMLGSLVALAQTKPAATTTTPAADSVPVREYCD